MSAPFETALRALEREAGADAGAHVLRTELRPNGTIVFTLDRGREPECFAWSADVLTRLDPRDETAIPFAGVLLAARAEGRARILAWRPGRRMVALLCEGSGELVAKAWRKGRSAAAVDLHEQAARAARGSFAVPPIVAVEPRHDAVLFERFAGHAADFSDPAWCRGVGAGLRALQERLPAQDLPRHGREQELAVLRDLAGRHRLACGDLPSGFEHTLATLATLVAEGREPSVAAHRDLHDGQFAVGAHATAWFDFDLAARAEPELDLANLSAHVAWCARQGVRGVDERNVGRALASLREGQGGALDERAFAFYLATTWLRLALVWGVRPRWARLAATLVEDARRAVPEVTRA